MVVYNTMETVWDSFAPTSSSTAAAASTLLPHNYYITLPL